MGYTYKTECQEYNFSLLDVKHEHALTDSNLYSSLGHKNSKLETNDS